VKTLPLIVTRPTRCDVVGLASTVYETEPFPLPAIVEMSSHEASVAAVHAHPVPAVTPMLPLAADAFPERAVVDRLYVQGGGGVLPGKTNWLETVLVVEPPGPTAATRAS
jgi:hypothetical protein